MPKGYVIFTEDIKDQEGMQAYVGQVVPTIMAHKGNVLVVDDAPQTLEGSWHGTRTVVVEFESVDAAKAWYESAEYQAARPLRLAAAESNAAILAGFEMGG